MEIKYLKFCECGCKTIIPDWSDRYQKARRFAPYHHSRGENNNAWIGGRRIKPDGYIQVRVKDHPLANQGYVLEHRLVWEQHNNALLLPWTHIHHINGNKTDNKIENLQPIFGSPHSYIHHPRLNKEGVYCEICHSETTQQSKTGYKKWYNYENDTFICHACYKKLKRKDLAYSSPKQT